MSARVKQYKPSRMKLPTLVYRRHRGDLIEIFKMMNGLYDEDVLPHFEMRADVASRSNNSRKNNKQIFITRCNKEVRANYFTQRVAPVWNGLAQEVVDAPTVDTFKKRLDKFWDLHPMKFNYTESVFNF